jgi:hypothetical protein
VELASWKTPTSKFQWPAPFRIRADDLDGAISRIKDSTGQGDCGAESSSPGRHGSLMQQETISISRLMESSVSAGKYTIVKEMTQGICAGFENKGLACPEERVAHESAPAFGHTNRGTRETRGFLY